MRILSLLLLLLLTAGPELAQAQILDSTQAARIRNKKPKREYDLPDPKPFAEGIRAEDLRPLVQVLASDSLEGRETGKPGQRKAANFIAQQFKALNLPTALEVVDYLKSKHLFENTAIFLISDNGGAPEAGVKGNFSRAYGDQTTIAE
ncbi:MAG TPA: hypothetical protein PK858_01100, partial [Saprospiraceae bacterium]|nr:hypothetical protein [Saprospiraceae bacterium]